MVIDAKTMIPIHELTEHGMVVWHLYILKMFAFKIHHPVMYKIGKIFGKFF